MLHGLDLKAGKYVLIGWMDRGREGEERERN